jgi:hypothetical protein
MRALRFARLAAALLCSAAAAPNDADIMAIWNCHNDHTYGLITGPDGRYTASSPKGDGGNFRVILSAPTNPLVELCNQQGLSVQTDGSVHFFASDCSPLAAKAPDLNTLQATDSAYGEVLTLERDDTDWRFLHTLNFLHTARSVRRLKTMPDYKGDAPEPGVYMIMQTGKCVMKLGPAAK